MVYDTHSENRTVFIKFVTRVYMITEFHVFSSLYVCMYVFYFQKHIRISHCNNREHEQSMCSEGQTGVKHLRLPIKTYKTRTKN